MVDGWVEYKKTDYSKLFGSGFSLPEDQKLRFSDELDIIFHSYVEAMSERNTIPSASELKSKLIDLNKAAQKLKLYLNITDTFSENDILTDLRLQKILKSIVLSYRVSGLSWGLNLKEMQSMAGSSASQKEVIIQEHLFNELKRLDKLLEALTIASKSASLNISNDFSKDAKRGSYAASPEHYSFILFNKLIALYSRSYEKWPDRIKKKPDAFKNPKGYGDGSLVTFIENVCILYWGCFDKVPQSVKGRKAGWYAVVTAWDESRFNLIS